ncbi:hypothetical protein [Clostridium beijerinckii]|uniref:Uncharacterized protein n=1 Tax=Clostridium beijerinckii TaxID=1520 RepID=A0AAW3W6Y9_CLOBE|nr:hypothetical protein [Clostridium beijerinckii]MBC2457532.1 hypothetical protein [Clostridium beijerinckii]MBC2474643.1 hypothetical protein [Clostridium beijerinckii]NOV62400.1 hypothetical protein [Clostridium beijerinckii]NOV68103.1 hypothetical protein [Clostridium beijerinckii]NOW30452.1 hypothetical protein [Clostridium beijerinckii]
MLEYIYKVNKFRVNFESDDDEELNEMYIATQWENMYMDVEFFKLSNYGGWCIDIYLSSREDNFAMILDREDVEDMIDIEELNEIIKVEEMEKILLKKINELYIDGEFVRYVDEYLDMRP